MSDILYVPIIKTGDAEMRGVSFLSREVKNSIVPLFELTRPRKSKRSLLQDNLDSPKLEKIKDVFGERRFILDLTGDVSLTSEKIKNLQDSTEGYKKWVEFLIALKKNKDWPDLIPTIQISDEGVDSKAEFYARIEKQVAILEKHFVNIAYRFPVDYQYFEEDIKHIIKKIPEDRLICVVDAEFIPRDKASVYAGAVVEIVGKTKNISTCKIVLTATSFPKSPTEYGGENDGIYQLEECQFFNIVRQTIKDKKLIYGDYATVNPVRNDQAGGNGWVPRIDMPTQKEIFYHRDKRKISEISYANAYERVAKRMVSDKKYKEARKIVGNCWGIEQIESAAEGTPEGMSPSFWISVRMNIHMTFKKGGLPV